MIQVHMEEQLVTPRVTALLATRNCVESLRRFLNTLAEGPEPEALEILVVDQGSTDGGASLDQQFPHVTFLRLPRLFGRTKALNIGIRTAKTDFLLLIEPWMTITGEQVNLLADLLSSNLDAVAVAPVTVDMQGNRIIRLHELPDAAALKAAWQAGGELPGRPVPANPAVTAAAAVSGTPLLVRRDFIRGMNYFDERYGEFGAMLELFWQIRRANRKVLVTQEIVLRGERGPDWNSLPAADRAIFSADFASGAATYLAKREGFAKSLSFRLGGILNASGRLLTFRSPAYAGRTLMNLLLGQKIDGTQ
jgi:N-acetylglucosaminyl-diphospho-decaprenol L-rhamnosyltransferase